MFDRSSAPSSLPRRGRRSPPLAALLWIFATWRGLSLINPRWASYRRWLPTFARKPPAGAGASFYSGINIGFFGSGVWMPPQFR